MSVPTGDSSALRAMSDAAFARYKRAEVASFAEDNVACGRWPAAGAHDRSLVEFDALLPDGLATPDHALMEIVDGDGIAVGSLWFAEETRGAERIAFVYDLQVDAAHRRRGHAGRALRALESIARSRGLARIGLHVSGRNPGAQRLYARLGFDVMGIGLSKSLARDRGPHEAPPSAAFAVIYRWRLHPGREQDFVDAWTRITTLLHAERGSLGARLHRGADGVWTSYAHWPSAQARDDAFAQGPVDPIAFDTMREAIAERFPEIVLETVVDRLA